MAGTDAAKTQVKGANGAAATIERATSDDVPAIKAMVQSAYTKYIERIGKEPAPMTTDYNKVLNTHDIFVLRPEGSPTAQGSIVLLARPDSDAVDINNLVVDVASQGKGYGRLLMNYAEDFARAKGRVALELYTNVKMWENIGLYAKMGFDEVDRRVEDGYERVYFRKPLN